MSDMLEQAIIDAEALKEAATKNAETLVLEKYSNQIKEAVDSLLEQEDLGAAMEADLGLGGGGAETPADPAAEGAGTTEESSIMEHIPLAVTELDDSKEIEIPLDKLLEEVENLSLSLNEFKGDVQVSDPELEESFFDEGLDEDLDEGLYEYEGLDEDLFEEDFDLMEFDELEEDFDLSEEEDLDEDLFEEDTLFEFGAGSGDWVHGRPPVEGQVVEALEVDLGEHSVKRGWAGLPESQFQLAEEELLALEQDSKVKEEKKALRDAVKKLDAVNETVTKQNKKLTSTLNKSAKYITKLRDAILVLEKKLGKSSLDNARLLYQNKALTSDSLNERQKQKLAEAVSNAETIEEAKVIFETLQNTVGSTSRKKQPNSLSEAVQKSSSMILSARDEKTSGHKNNPTLDRWKFLAGIDKQ